MSLVQTLAVIDGNGNAQNIPTIPNNLAAHPCSFSGGGSNTVAGGTGGQTLKLYRLFLVVAGATTITLQDTGGSLALYSVPYVFGSNGGILSLPLDGYAHLETGSGNGFVINSSNAVQVSGVALLLSS